jgi:hypothetical protein
MSGDEIRPSEVGKPFTEVEVRGYKNAMAEREGLREVSYEEVLRVLRLLKLKELAISRYNLKITEPGGTLELALRLAIEHEPGFRETKGRGRPKKALKEEDVDRMAGMAIEMRNGASMTAAAKEQTNKPKAPKPSGPETPVPAEVTKRTTIKPVSSEELKKDYIRLRNTGGIAAALPMPPPSNRGRKGKNRKPKAPPDRSKM